jgi:hypothetical protein
MDLVPLNYNREDKQKKKKSVPNHSVIFQRLSYVSIVYI